MAARHHLCVLSDHLTPIDVATIHSLGTARDRDSMDRQNISTILTPSFSIALRHIGANAKMGSQISPSICRREKC